MRIASGTILIKPVHTLDTSLDGLHGYARDARSREAISEIIEASADATDEGLIPILT
jgi:hypothetical protein